MGKPPLHKHCVVPQCSSSSEWMPHKLFFRVPTGAARAAWCAAMRRAPLSPTCTRYCCEDHFNLETDMKNYMQWKIMGRKKFNTKKGVVPHKFACQETTAKPEEDKSEGELLPLVVKSPKIEQQQIDNTKETLQRNLLVKMCDNNASTFGTQLNEITNFSHNILPKTEILQKMSDINTNIDTDSKEMQAIEKYTVQVKVEIDIDINESGYEYEQEQNLTPREDKNFIFKLEKDIEHSHYSEDTAETILPDLYNPVGVQVKIENCDEDLETT